MRYLIISDIHGNLEALQSVLDSARRQKFDRILCLGDTVGFGPNPNECLQLLKGQRHSIVLMGNWEATIAGLIGKEWIQKESVQKCFEWTEKELSEENLEYIKEMPKFFSINFLLGVHASPFDPLLQKMNEEIAKKTLESIAEQVTVTGHIHQPFYYTKKDGWKKIEGDKTLKLVPERIVITLPSVGKPKDEDQRTGYGILDFQKKEFYIRRLNYDYETTQKKMKEQKLPEEEIQGLETGT